MRYSINFQKRDAVGARNVPGAIATSLLSDAEFSALPSATYGGQTCRRVSVPDNFVAGGDVCVWDRYGYTKYLNWPWIMSGRLAFSIGGGTETIEFVEVQRDQPIDPALFEIPVGFAVTGG